MRNNSILKPGRILFKLTIPCIAFFLLIPLQSDMLGQAKEQEDQIKKAKIYQEIYPIISVSDLYCSFLILDDKTSDLEIIGGEREYERMMFTEADIVYINKGKNSGLQKDQMFLILEIGSPIKGYGPVAFKRGKLRIMALGETKSSAKIEKACGQVMKGNILVPFEEKEGLLGKDLGYDVPPEEAAGLKGSVIFLQEDYNQIGKGHWALIDLGEEDGLYFGQQLIVYRKVQEGAPIQVLGNIVVIDVQKKTSTIKVLSCRDTIELGDLVQSRS